MRKREFAEKLIEERQNVLKAMEGLTHEEMCCPLADGKWSISETLAHLAAWEGEAVKAFEQKARGERPTIGSITDFDAWNQVEAGKRKNRTLEENLAELNENRKRLLAIINDLPDEGDVWSPERMTSKLLQTLIDHDKHHCRQIWERRPSTESTRK